MATPTYPGVYVEEISSGVRPITTASTSTAAFIGEAEKGSLTEAVKIYNFTQFQSLYGGFIPGGPYLAHAVYQFFNNGGAQCYIIRVAGDGIKTASIGLKDRAVGNDTKLSLTIKADSPGIWGNRIEVVVKDGTRDRGNEFNLEVYYDGEDKPRETYANLSMAVGMSNFVETATSNSKLIRVTTNKEKPNAKAGTSRGASAPSSLLPDKQKLQINVDNDGYQEINLQDAVGSSPGKVANLGTAANVAAAIQYVVRLLKPLRSATTVSAFVGFTCILDAGVLLLTSGTVDLKSSVAVKPAVSSAQDATGSLKLGLLQLGALETLGSADARPVNNSTTVPRYLVGDQDPSNAGVFTGSIVLGHDGIALSEDQEFIKAFDLLDKLNDVSLIAVPGRGSKELVGAGMNYCANTRPLSDCFFIGDMAADDDTEKELRTFVEGISPKNSYGAVYAPWLLMSDPTGKSKEPIAVPPSGFVAGMYAKTDAQRGVWKAPAGTAAALAGATGLKVNFTDVEQGNVNVDPYHVNLIRQFPAAGRIIWGARTITADAEWKYIPVRRMAILLRVSIYNGIQWAVFEPNDAPLWSQLRLNIQSFMMSLYRRGAFQGSTPSQAFFVKCDGETTTQDDIDQGIVNILVGFAPLKPAEFVMVKISQKSGQS
jgi:hypothetical protein